MVITVEVEIGFVVVPKSELAEHVKLEEFMGI